MSVFISRSRLDRQLAARGLTGHELAQLAGVSPATISAARQGQPVTPRTLRKIVTALLRVPIVPGVEDLLEPDAKAS